MFLPTPFIAVRPLIEELEPRLLYSADLAPVLADAALPQMEQRLMGDDGEFASATNSPLPAQHARFEVVFIDLRVQDTSQILASIQQQNTDGRSIEVVLLDTERDGIVQIGEFLGRHQDIDAVHIISHGSAGAVQLGAGLLNFDSLLKNASGIKQWGNALSDQADILIYGCDLAASETGQSLIGALGRLTGADVAASDDKTGAASLGGDYDLEYTLGTIDSQAVFTPSAQQTWAHVLGVPVAASDVASTTENVVITVSAPGVLANDRNPDAASLTAGATLNFTTDGDNIWTNQTATPGYDWTITNLGTQSGYTTAPTTVYPGIVSAYQFSGTNSGATMPRLDGLPGDPTNNSASFEIWFRPDVLNATSGQHIIFEAGGTDSGTSLYLDNTLLRFATHTGGAAVDQVSVDLAALYDRPTSEFIQAMGVIDQTGGQMQLYIDGNLRATKSLSGMNGTDWAGPDGSGLGREFTNVSTGPAAGSGTLDGDIAIFRLYEKALTATEATANFTAIAGSSAGLVVSQVQGSAGYVGNEIALASGALLTLNADGSYTYNPNNRFEYLGAGQSATDSFSYTVTNASGSSATTMVMVTVNGVNDAPVATNLNAAETYIEDTPLNLTDIVVSDVDSATVSVTLTLSNAAAGNLNTATSGTVTSSFAGGVWTASGAVADVNALLAALTFTPTADFNASFTLATRVSDGVAPPLTGTKAFTGIATNDAPGFGNGDGAVTTDFGAGDIAYAVAVQADGKILLAGSARVGGNDDFALARYNIDGSLDTGFGIAGKVTTAISSGTDWAHGVAVQADGRIVVVGRGFNGSTWDVAVVRYNADGSLDTGFGAGGTGIVLVDYGGGNDVGNMVALQADGKIVVSARARIGSTDDFAVLRLNTDGTLDTSFGATGKVTTAIGPGNESGQRLTIQSDGKIVVSGYASNGTNNDFAVVRYNADGTLDTGFGGTGIVTTAIGAGNDSGSGVAVQADGKIVVAGASSNGSNDDFAIVRYNANGTLDTSFGGTGKITTAIGPATDQGQGLRLQADGKIVVGGLATMGGTSDFAVVRYNTDGSLDTSFGSGGKTTVAIGLGNDISLEMALQADGQILLAGRSHNGSNDDFALVRIGTSGTPDSSFDQLILNGRPSYVENGAAVVLDSDVQIFDAELAAAGNYAGASLTLSRNGGAHAQDVFSATGNLSTLAQGGNLVLSGVTIGTVTTNSSGTLLLAFNGNATQARINEALQSIAYANGSDAPPTSVQINWVFSDGNTGAQGSGGSLLAAGSTTVNIIAVNDAPATTNQNTPETYVEDTVLDLTGIIVSDADSATVTVTLTLSNAVAGNLNTATSGTVTSSFAGGVWTAPPAR